VRLAEGVLFGYRLSLLEARAPDPHPETFPS
jgi:hypothetical protein